MHDPALAASGHAAATPPGSVMNARLEKFMQQAEPFRLQVTGENVDTCCVFAGPVQARDQPRLDRISGLFGVMLNPKFPAAAQQAAELAEAARTIGRPIILLNASTDAELDAALAALVQQRVVAMLVVGDPFFDTRRYPHYRLRGTTKAARPLPISRICNGRRVDEL